jgi:mono/diheme cytochrome c family protein
MIRRAWSLCGLVALCAAWCGEAAAQQTAALNDTQALGQKLFTQSCMVCHTKPQITSGMYGPALSRETAGGDAAILHGVISDGTPRMPGFKYLLTPVGIDAIVAYIKTLPPPAAGDGPGTGKGDVD